MLIVQKIQHSYMSVLPKLTQHKPTENSRRDFFYFGRDFKFQEYFKFHMGLQRTRNSQYNLKKDEQIWRVNTTLFQDLL